MKFGSKYMFNTLFLLTGIVTLWVGALFISKFVMFLRFSHHATGQATHWGVITKSEDVHCVYADYTFTIGDQAYAAQHVFSKPRYPSKDSAQYAIEAKETDQVSVWYMKRGGGKVPLSILDRKFPYNELIRLIIVFAIHSYFFFLKRYLYRLREGVVLDETTSEGSKATT